LGGGMGCSNWLLVGARLDGRLCAVRGHQRPGVPTYGSLGRGVSKPDFAGLVGGPHLGMIFTAAAFTLRIPMFRFWPRRGSKVTRGKRRAPGFLSLCFPFLRVLRHFVALEKLMVEVVDLP
jgi:hypothetical protein